MKKFLCLLMILSLAFMFSACTDNTEPPKDTQTQQDISEENTELTTEDIISIFKAVENDDSISVADCVLTPDGAYDLIGVVQYSDSEKPCKLAFVDKDGVSQPVGLDANIAGDSVLTYAGGGTVNFKIVNKDGLDEDYFLTFSGDDDGVHFTAKSEAEI